MHSPVPPSPGRRWVDAWAHARGLDVGTVDGWPIVRVLAASRESEIVSLDPGIPAFVALLPHIAGDPRAMLTVIAPDLTHYTALELPPTIRVDRDDETLMTTRLAPLPAPALESGLAARWSTDGPTSTLTLETGDRVAAEGSVGIRGTDAVFDAIETTPAFQRRGLGRHVMAALTAHALAHGATDGVLAATDVGRRLYESLGWDATLGMWSLMGVDGPE